MIRQRKCRDCGDLISRAAPLRPTQCIGCYIVEQRARNFAIPPRPALKMTRAVRTVAVQPFVAQPKDPAFRSKALRQSARGEPCIACGGDNETTVWAHSNEMAHGKAKGRKGHDLLGLYLCSVCHNLFDGSPSWTREQKHAFFREHYPATMVRISEKLARGELVL